MTLDQAILTAKNAAHASRHTLVTLPTSDMQHWRGRYPGKDDYLVTKEGRLLRITNVLCGVGYSVFRCERVWPGEGETYAPYPDVAYFLMLEPL
jgi:hypothetical protein